jgi:uncharacterized protein (DUF433 family)
MSAPVTYPHIAVNNDGVACLASHPRTRVAQIVMDYLAHGWSPEEICRHYPYLTLSETHAAMTYYYDHREQVDAEIRAELEQVEELRQSAGQSPFFARLWAQGRQ